MKKNILIALLAAVLALSVTSCGKDNKSALVTGEEKPKATQNVETKKDDDTSKDAEDAKEQQSVEEQLEHFAENADKEVNMAQIEGIKAQTDVSGKHGDGKMTTCNVSVDEVKLADIDGSNIIFVEYTFKNTSDSELNFAGEVYAEAYQDGMELSAAVFRDTIEGFSPSTTAQKVAPGDSIKVQKAFATADVNTPVEIYVRDTYDQTGKTYLSQVFKLK